MRIMRVAKGADVKRHYHFRIGQSVWLCRFRIGRWVLASLAWKPGDEIARMTNRDFDTLTKWDHILGIVLFMILLFGAPFVDWIFG